MTSVLAPVYSARDSAVTQRPTSTALLCIDSEDRFRDYTQARSAFALTGVGVTPYNFTITKNESMMNGFFTRLGVTEVVFPWVIPNINRNTNKINVTYDVGAGQVTVMLTLNIGFYTPSMIASEIQRQVRLLDAGLAGFTMTYGISTLVVGLPPVQSPIFEYKTNNPAATIGFDDVGGDPRRKQLFDLLGFEFDNGGLDPENDGNETYCQATRYIDIVCTQLTVNQALKDTMSQPIVRDVLCRVYVGDAQGVQSTTLPSASTFCPPGCMPTTIYRDFSQPKQIQWIPNQPVPGYLRFEVYDDSGFALQDSLPTATGNGANWSMTLLVTEN